jgi:quercetin dioxygenase-like cupin family protein
MKLRSVKVVCTFVFGLMCVGIGATFGSHGGPDVAFELLGFGTYGGDAGRVHLKLKSGDVRDVMTLKGHVPVGGETRFHYHPEALWFVTVQSGTVALYHSENCPPTLYAPGDVIIEHSDRIHNLTNAGDTEAEILATGILVPGEEITVYTEPDEGKCR